MAQTLANMAAMHQGFPGHHLPPSMMFPGGLPQPGLFPGFPGAGFPGPLPGLPIPIRIACCTAPSWGIRSKDSQTRKTANAAELLNTPRHES